MTDKIRTLQGRVVSDKMEKSIVVAIERFVKHRSTVNSSSVRPNCTYMTRTTNVVSATRLKSVNAVHCPRLSPDAGSRCRESGSVIEYAFSIRINGSAMSRLFFYPYCRSGVIMPRPRYGAFNGSDFRVSGSS